MSETPSNVTVAETSSTSTDSSPTPSTETSVSPSELTSQQTQESTDTQPVVDPKAKRQESLASRERRLVAQKRELAERRKFYEDSAPIVENAQKFHELAQQGPKGILEALAQQYGTTPKILFDYLSEHHLTDVLGGETPVAESDDARRAREMSEKLERLERAEEQRQKQVEAQQRSNNVKLSEKVILDHKAEALMEYQSDVEGQRTGAELLLYSVQKYAADYRAKYGEPLPQSKLNAVLPDIVTRVNDWAQDQINAELSRLKPRLDRISKLERSNAQSGAKDQKSPAAPDLSADASNDQTKDQSKKGQDKLTTLSNQLPAADALTLKQIEEMSLKEVTDYYARLERMKNK